MEPQLSVLLYSKYSNSSNNLMNHIDSRKIDIGLQPICIDNEQIRSRILKNKQIQVTSVPCILLIYPDGGIEKYDGESAFQWVESIIAQFTPPQPPPTPQPTDEEKFQRKEKLEREKQRMEEYELEQAKKHKKMLERKKNKEKFEREKFEREQAPDTSRPKKHRRNLITEEQSDHTPINELVDLPSDEEDTVASDRYRTRKPVGRIRTDQGNYETDEDLFQGETLNMRHAKRSAIKGLSKNSTDQNQNNKQTDLMTRAKEMEKDRKQPPPPPGHPANRP